MWDAERVRMSTESASVLLPPMHLERGSSSGWATWCDIGVWNIGSEGRALPTPQQPLGMPKRTRYATESRFAPSRVGRLQRSQTKRSSGRRARNALVSVPRNKMAFPQSMATTLRYCEAVTFNLNNSNVSTFTFRANDLFDPSFTGTGHQPRGFDELMAVYNKFTVKASRISVHWTYSGYLGPVTADATKAQSQSIQSVGSPTTVSACPPLVGLIQKSTETAMGVGTPYQQMEKERVSWVHITPSEGGKTARAKLATSDFFGKDFLVGADGYTGTAGAGPTNQLYYHIACGQNTNEVISDPEEMQARALVRIEYDAVFTEPKPLASS
uniref:Capsid protein n=1 Tax=uncultured marine virus TaxID=186617 RepID=S4TDT4_9VIRU|nr:hypothetical protein [uncultured marine virus]